MDSQKEEVKQKLDIADVIGSYISLKPAGVGSFKAVCPFHSERTPSFHVSRERQIWKCFGCDKGGDVFSFVMEIEGLGFLEALQLLAQKAGVVLVPRAYDQYSAMQQQESKDRKELFLLFYHLAQEYYTQFLFHDPRGEMARAYVRSRNIGQQLASTFLLGASGDAWDGLSRFLKNKGYSDQDLVDSGLVLKKRNGDGIIDRFRNRLMVPICDAQGRVIAFTGRILPAAMKEGVDYGGKYVNSPETLLYKKSETLYGLHLAKAAIRKMGEVILVEGNLDVIASHKAGVAHVVAVSGTALTAAQLHTLSRFTKRIILCLDDDDAGFAAAKRALALLWGEHQALGFEIRCISIPEGLGKDPDEVVQKGIDVWQKLVMQSEDIMEYVFQKTVRSFAQGGVLKAEDYPKLIDALSPYLTRITRSDVRYLYFSRLADMTHVPVAVLESRIVPQKKVDAAQSKKQIATQPTASKMPTLTSPEAFLFGLCLCFPEWIPRVLEAVDLTLLQEPWKTLYEYVKSVYTSPDSTPSIQRHENQSFFSRLRTQLEQSATPAHVALYDAVALHVDTLVSALSPADVAQEGEKHILLLQKRRQDQLRRDLLSRIREAELQNDTALTQRLLGEYQKLLS